MLLQIYDVNLLSTIPFGFTNWTLSSLSFHQQLFNCQLLHRLSMPDNDLSVLPAAIANLINLRELDVSKNSKEELWRIYFISSSFLQKNTCQVRSICNWQVKWVTKLWCKVQMGSSVVVVPSCSNVPACINPCGVMADLDISNCNWKTSKNYILFFYLVGNNCVWIAWVIPTEIDHFKDSLR